MYVHRLIRWKGENNEIVYKKCCMRFCATGVKHGVEEWVKTSTMRWFGYTEDMKSEEIVKIVCE